MYFTIFFSPLLYPFLPQPPSTVSHTGPPSPARLTMRCLVPPPRGRARPKAHASWTWLTEIDACVSPCMQGLGRRTQPSGSQAAPCMPLDAALELASCPAPPNTDHQEARTLSHATSHYCLLLPQPSHTRMRSHSSQMGYRRRLILLEQG
jgi:hypothetical protein